MKTKNTEYRVTFYVDGELYDVIAAYDMRLTLVIAARLCRKYREFGELTIVGSSFPVV